MIKRIVLALILSLGALSACAKHYDEGINYQTINSKPVNEIKPGDHEVAEFFWYACPHCFHFEPALQGWLKSKPDNVKFIRIPAPLNPSWVMHTKAYYAAETLGVADEAHEGLFRRLHEQRDRSLMTLDGLAKYYAQYDGVTVENFTVAYNSFAVDSKLRKAMELVKRFDLHGVPVVVIDGKYKSEATMAGSHADLVGVISQLTE